VSCACRTAAADGGRRLACFAHALQLVVPDGMQSIAFARAAIAKVCKLSSLVHQSA